MTDSLSHSYFSPGESEDAAPVVPAAPSLELLYRRHRAELIGYLRNTYGEGPPDAEDIVQACFARLARAIERHPVDDPRALLFATARNIMVDEYRHRRVCTAFAEGADVGRIAEATDEFHAERIVEARQSVVVLSAAIRRLPTIQRRVLAMNRFEGLSFAEIARQTGIPQTTVKRHAAAALAACRFAMREAGFEDKEGPAE